jgi:hypothetical protein
MTDINTTEAIYHRRGDRREKASARLAAAVEAAYILEAIRR